MILDDQILLQRYTASRDAEAFAQLVRRYSAMVYSVACRVTGNIAAAEDVTQDCFVALARQTAAIRGSLPAWLHRVALNRSMEVIRSDATRQRREAAASTSRPAREATWKEIMPVVDAALAELPEDLREPLVQHFLLGRSQVQIAEALGVNQATVSRRTTEGIERLRGHIRRSGFVCGVALLTGGLAQSASAAVPATLAASLGKIAMAGPVKAAATGTIAAVIAANIKVIAVVVAAAVGASVLTYELVPHNGSIVTSDTADAGLTVGTNTALEDAVCLAFQAAAKSLGKDTDYETVYAASTNALSPAVSPQWQKAKGYWHIQPWLGDKGIQTIAARYGLSARRLDLSNPPANPVAYRKALAPAISRELDAGHAVIVISGWRYGDHVGPWAGVVTRVESDGTIMGTTIGGRQDCRLENLGSIWSIAPDAGAMSRHAADVEVLRLAVMRIHGKGPFATTREENYGLVAMDLWIKAMNKTAGFCPCSGCQGRLHQASELHLESAYINAQAIQTASEISARYLRGIASDVPEAARPHLEAAGGHYDRIVSLLSPCLQDSGPGSYLTILGDMEMQREHATKVLKPVREEYEAIAKELELALNMK